MCFVQLTANPYSILTPEDWFSVRDNEESSGRTVLIFLEMPMTALVIGYSFLRWCTALAAHKFVKYKKKMQFQSLLWS